MYGAQVTFVNSACTSQTCDRCGHTDRKSRRTRSLFVCTRCRHAHAHAATGAAVNIKNRATTDTPAGRCWTAAMRRRAVGTPAEEIRGQVSADLAFCGSVDYQSRSPSVTQDK